MPQKDNHFGLTKGRSDQKSTWNAFAWIVFWNKTSVLEVETNEKYYQLQIVLKWNIQ